MSYWFRDNENRNPIVLSTRIRLARNLSGLPFPYKMTTEMRNDLNAKIKDIIKNNIKLINTTSLSDSKAI